MTEQRLARALGPEHTVLVLTDLTAESVAAAKVAAAVAPAARIHLFHVLSRDEEEEMRIVGIAPAVIRRQRQVLTADAHIRMHALVSSIEGSERFVYAVGHGDLVPLTLHKIEAIGADLLVLHRRPRPVVRAFWRAGTAQRLVDRSPCHVLAVHRDPARDLAAASAFALASMTQAWRAQPSRVRTQASKRSLAATMSPDP